MKERAQAVKDALLTFLGTKRFGVLDALLVLLVIVPVWQNTPVGSVGLRVLGIVWAEAPEAPTLTSYFQTGPPSEVVDWAIDLIPDLDDLEVLDEGSLPALPRMAARSVFAKKMPAATKAQLEKYADVPEADRLMALLDDLYEGDAEAALEIAAIGPEARDRAIARATAAGFDNPESLEVHRAFLSGGAGRDADKYVSGTLAMATALDLRWPVDADYRISSKYGNRFHPVYKKNMLHNGVDIAIPIGTQLYSPQDGKVLTLDENDRSGKFMVIDHGNGVRTSFCHLSKFQLEKGDTVIKGDPIAESGNTGRSTGPHLHYVTRIGGKSTDPLKLHRMEKTAS